MSNQIGTNTDIFEDFRLERLPFDHYHGQPNVKFLLLRSIWMNHRKQGLDRTLMWLLCGFFFCTSFINTSKRILSSVVLPNARKTHATVTIVVRILTPWVMPRLFQQKFVICDSEL